MSATARIHEKDRDLDVIKKHAAKILAQCNTLNVEYADWFTRKQQTFIDAVKSVQVGMTSLVPAEISTIQEYRALCEMAATLTRNGRPVRHSDKLDRFLSYWERLYQLKQDLIFNVVLELDRFLLSVSSLREPGAKEQLDQHRAILTGQFSESFNFVGAHNEKDNLYTYRLNVSDQRFLGLVSYIPYLLHHTTRVCFFVGKINILTLSD